MMIARKTRMEIWIVSENSDKHDELLAEVEKAEARQQQAAGHGPLPDRSPPEKVGDLIREHPGIAIAAGIGLGLLAATLLPKGPGRKLLRRGGLVASAATEMALLLGQQAMAKASEATEESRERISEQVSEAAKRTSAASRAAGKNVQRIASEATATVRDAGSDLAKKASKTLSRLRD
jgi:hypothetical protein